VKSGGGGTLKAILYLIIENRNITQKEMFLIIGLGTTAIKNNIH